MLSNYRGLVSLELNQLNRSCLSRTREFALINKNFRREFHLTAKQFDKNEKDDDQPPEESADDSKIKNYPQLRFIGNNYYFTKEKVQNPAETDSIPPVLPIMSALAPIQVPDFFPKIPIIAVSRNPLFPRFIRMIEVFLSISYFCFIQII